MAGGPRGGGVGDGIAGRAGHAAEARDHREGGPAAALGAPQPVRIPPEPPRWASEQIDADGRGSGVNRLKAARAAEGVALTELRKKIDALSLGDTTIGQAAKADPRIERAVAGVVHRAPTSRVQYGADSANVRVSLDLGLLWRELIR